MDNFPKKFVCSTLLGLVLFLLINCLTPGTAYTEENKYIVERDIVYGQGGDVELKLDLACPTVKTAPFPALIFLSSNDYHCGDRSGFFTEIQEAAKRGYVAVTIDFRLAYVKVEDGKMKYQFPAQLHDAKCAVRWLKANATEYNIDNSRIGVVGYSAGGNLALMLGLTDASDGLEGDCGDFGISSRIQAVVNLSGSTDMVVNYKVQRRISYLLGGTPEELPDRYRDASPLTYVTPDDPPVLTICGTRDKFQPQEKLLDDKMRMVGVSHNLIIIEGAGHGLFELVNFYQNNPVWDFLDKHLKNNE